MTRLRIPVGPLVAAVLVACGGGTSPEAPRPEPAVGDPSLAELEALFQARQAEALENVHPADVAFVTGMIGHHAQALVMSRNAREAGASPEIRTLAARIINAQRDEITNMQRWLRDRELPTPAVAEDGTVRMPEAAGMDHAGMDHEAMDHSGMPGMLTAAQLRELSQARGPAFDRLFLTYMIQHHEGAVTMVHELFAVDGAAQDETIFKLASDIQVDQITEIDRMRLILNRMNAPGGR